MSVIRPSVTAIMLTTDHRKRFVEQSRQCFREQKYDGPKELLIWPGAGTVGAKRNEACHAAKGEIIVHWDDDDWQHPCRIADHVDRLRGLGTQVDGYHTFLNYDERDARSWEYFNDPGYACGASLAYWKTFWESHPFKEIQIGQDEHFAWQALQERKLSSVNSIGMMVARLHHGNTSPKNLRGANYREVPTARLPEGFLKTVPACALI